MDETEAVLPSTSVDSDPPAKSMSKPCTQRPMEIETLSYLHQYLPTKAHKGLLTVDVDYTRIDVSPDYIAIGTDIGFILVYDRQQYVVQRLSCQSKTEVVTSVKMQESVDYVVAAGTASGLLVIFQLPSILPGRVKQLQMFTVRDVHHCQITCLTWSQNAVKLFSGDQEGNVVCTEMDYNKGTSSSYIVCHESHSVQQLDYAFKSLLISTRSRSVLCHMDRNNSLIQVGTKPRKSLGEFGACFMQQLCRPEEAILYACRPGMRIWKANKEGIVQATYIFKTLLDKPTPVLTILPDTSVNTSPLKTQDKNFGKVIQFREKLLVTWNASTIYVLDPVAGAFVGYQSSLGNIQDVSINHDEIFILRKGHNRRIVRLAHTQDTFAPKGLPPVVLNLPNQERRSSSPALSNTSISPSPKHLLHQTANKIVEAFREVGEIIQEGQKEAEVPPWGAAPGSRVAGAEGVVRSPSVDSCREAGSSSSASPAKSTPGDVMSASLDAPQEDSIPSNSQNESDEILTVQIVDTKQSSNKEEQDLRSTISIISETPEETNDIVFSSKNKRPKKKKVPTATLR